jgi:hypothetical protein
VTCGIGNLVGLILGIAGRRQVKRSNGRELGSGLALWGAILNGLVIVAVIVTIVAIALTSRSPWQGRSTKHFDSAATITKVLECPGKPAAPSVGSIDGVSPTSSARCHADGEDLVVLVYAHRRDLDRAFEGSVAFDPQTLGGDCTVAGDNWVVMADTDGNDLGLGKQAQTLTRYAANGLQQQLGGSVVCETD